jgi:large subunit ribosomal protein L25
LNVVNRQVEIECLPTEFPENITADISNLGVGDALHVSDLKIPAGVKLISSPETTVAVVNLFVEEVIAAPTAAEAAPAAGAAAPAAGAAAPAAGAAAAPAAGAKKEEKK